MTDVWGNVASTLETSGENAGNKVADTATNEATDFVSHTITGFYDSYSLENQTDVAGFTSNIAGFDPNAEWIASWDWNDPDWESLLDIIPFVKDWRLFAKGDLLGVIETDQFHALVIFSSVILLFILYVILINVFNF